MVHLLDEFNSSDNEVDLNVDDDGLAKTLNQLFSIGNDYEI